MFNRDVAATLIEEAKGFNFFGAANKKGSHLQNAVLTKYKAWKKDNSIKFNEEELSILKAVVAQSLVEEEMKPLMAYAPDEDANLPPSKRVKKRILHCLKTAKILATCGSFNCEIGNLVIGLTLIKKITTPVELITFSGVSDDEKQDTVHAFVTLGGSADVKILGLASKRKQKDYKNDEYVICDAHHLECYPFTQALSDPNVRLARYDDINHRERAMIRRFLYIENPAELYKDKAISALCQQLLEARDNPVLKQQVEDIFREINPAPAKVAGTPKAEIKAGAPKAEGAKADAPKEEVKAPAKAAEAPKAVVGDALDEKEVKLVNDKLCQFFKITEKTKGNQVWVVAENAPDTYEMVGSLIPITGRRYFANKLIKIGLTEGTDFNFIAKPEKDAFVLRILNVKNPKLVAALEVATPSALPRMTIP